jgi:adenylate kinase family enzyme
MKITVLVGLPGSGKSHYGRALAKERNIPFFDDCATDTDVWDKAVICIASGQDCVLADPGFCIDRIKKKFVDQIIALNNSIDLNFIYFANEPDVCVNNLSKRTDGRKVSKRFAYDLSNWYTVPEGAVTIPCYRSN